MQLTEADLYNLHSSSNGATHDVKAAANAYALRLMVEHLYFVHNMKIREISRILRYKEKNVKAIIAEAKN